MFISHKNNVMQTLYVTYDIKYMMQFVNNDNNLKLKYEETGIIIRINFHCNRFPEIVEL